VAFRQKGTGFTSHRVRAALEAECAEFFVQRTGGLGAIGKRVLEKPILSSVKELIRGTSNNGRF
jgi:hypothetical protein